MTETATPQTTPVEAQRPCTCSTYVAATETEVDGQPDYIVELSTECPGVPTTRDFAPGHDAKLKSMLIKAGVAGLSVTDQKGIWSDPATIARKFGFGRMVEDGIRNGRDKAEARRAKATYKAAKAEARATELGRKAQEKAQKAAERKAAKNREIEDRVIAKADAERAKAEVPEVRESHPVQIKVGRWEYPAEIDFNGTATFVDGKGETQTREEGTYRLLSV